MNKLFFWIFLFFMLYMKTLVNSGLDADFIWIWCLEFKYGINFCLRPKISITILQILHHGFCSIKELEISMYPCT